MTLATDQTQRAIALIEQLPPDQLVIALNFLEQLRTKTTQPLARPSEHDLTKMANDPDIQAELRTIEQEFAIADMDGLSVL
jgi:hypothetical protein